MKIYGKCGNCKNEIEFRTYSNTRAEFAMNEGEIKKPNCKNCGQNNEIHVDELYAKESKLALIIAGIIFLVGTITIILTFPLMFMVGFIGVPLIAYGIIRKQERTRVNSFNHSKLKGRIHNIGLTNK